MRFHHWISRGLQFLKPHSHVLQQVSTDKKNNSNIRKNSGREESSPSVGTGSSGMPAMILAGATFLFLLAFLEDINQNTRTKKKVPKKNKLPPPAAGPDHNLDAPGLRSRLSLSQVPEPRPDL